MTPADADEDEDAMNYMRRKWVTDRLPEHGEPTVFDTEVHLTTHLDQTVLHNRTTSRGTRCIP